MNLNITKVKVLTSRQCADSLILYTELPEGCYPYRNKADAEMRVASGGGEEYAREHFKDCEIVVVQI